MKKFLEKNKIYFDIVSSVMFGAAALFISLASYNLSKEQLEISKVSTRPHFYIDKVLYKNPETKEYNDSEMNIYNAGAPAYNIDIVHYEFIEVQYYGKDPMTKLLLVSGYYLGQINNYTPNGLISTLKGPGNNGVMAALDFRSLDIAKSRDEYFELKLKLLVAITYSGNNGESTTEYYLDQKQVSRSSVESMITASKEQFPIYLRETTVESILTATNEK
ncbi:hypothetical protein [Cellvibrio polysaccharolyticus]|uniref:Uncharacterized protein n=1 Tax=Cellvibrio polysaccharolyticus TaxID=2082724 RepID=A0A928YSD4_9GAMM|nr:hypothetical protein [Cellvibrio polysaccharolyticus]MBE8715889.1 hypothetical protein [Cellvibrio polysaccharolyticus]